MPVAIATKEQVLERLLEVFRDKGYDGASLAELSSATGLGKSSLYHHFPGGKVDMAKQVLAHLERALEADLLTPLRGSASPQKKLDAMLAAISAFYAGGEKACLLERLAASADQKRFRRPLASLVTRWVDAVAELGREAGLATTTARARAEDLVIRIEGALVVAACTGNPGPFQRTLSDVRRSLLEKPRP